MSQVVRAVPLPGPRGLEGCFVPVKTGIACRNPLNSGNISDNLWTGEYLPDNKGPLFYSKVEFLIFHILVM